jgi:hypothetical protein
MIGWFALAVAAHIGLCWLGYLAGIGCGPPRRLPPK